MLDLCPRPRQDYRVSAKKALIKVESLKEHNGKHAAYAVFLCSYFLARLLWVAGMGGFCPLGALCPVFQPVPLLPALAIESASGLIHNDKEIIL